MGKNPRAIVAVTNDLYTDNRVDKICTFLHEQGYDVLLVGRKLRKSVPLEKRAYKMHRMKLIFEKKAVFYAEYNIRLCLLLLFRKAKLIVANDLDTLLGVYIAHRLKPFTRLVYDSHEYFTEAPALTGRSAKQVWMRIEAWIFPKLQTVYTVNQSIADIYQKKYKVNVEVVRNVAPLWTPSYPLKTREALKLPADLPLIIIQGSGINIDRGTEEAIQAMHLIDNACLIFVGNGDVIPQLKSYVKEHNMIDKVLFFDKLPYQQMMNYTYHATIGLSVDKATNKNHEFSLPNKIFDYIQTCTPIICTPLVEVKKIVETHQVGYVLEELTPESIASAIQKLLTDKQFYQQLQENCNKARTVLNWEHEKKTLSTIYPNLLNKK